MFERLSDEKIKEITRQGRQSLFWSRKLTQAQLQQDLEDLIKWGQSECTHHRFKMRLEKRWCPDCWQELKDKLEKTQNDK